jgi:uncharacterized protein
MVVGILQIELAIDWATSLKDKRRVVSSLKDRLHREHQVSIAEVDSQDEARTATLGIALAASDVRHAQSMLDRVLAKITDEKECVVRDHRQEILTGR